MLFAWTISMLQLLADPESYQDQQSVGVQAHVSTICHVLNIIQRDGAHKR
jgi:hypothetical protein